MNQQVFHRLLHGLILFSLYNYVLYQMNGKSLLDWGFHLCAGGSYTSMVLFTAYLFKSRVLKASMAFLSLSFLFANVLHYRYFENPIVLGSLYSVKNIPFVWNYILNLLIVNDLFFFLGVLLLTLMLLRDNGVPSYKVLLPILFICLLLTGVRFYGCTIGPYRESRSLKHTLDVTLFHLHKRNMVTLGFGFIPPLVVEAYQFFESNQDFGPAPEYKLILKPNMRKPNIFLIQVESLPFKIIDMQYQGDEITPFLNSLKEKGTFFTNIFPQHTAGGGTSDADFSTLTSLLPKRDMPSLYAKGLDQLISLPKILKSAGYTTVAYHANTGGFYGRAYGYEKLGFDAYISKKTLPAPPQGLLVVPDDLLFNFALSQIRKLDKPVFSFFVTLTSHGPYNTQELIPEKYRSNSEFSDKHEMYNYITAIRYVDSSLEHFVHAIQSEYEDNLIVIYGDHPPLIKELSLKGNEDVPLFILYKDKDIIIETSYHGSHYDIPSTIISLLKYNVPINWSGKNLIKK